MFPEIYSNGDKKAILNNLNANTLLRRVNNKYVFNFDCYAENLKSEYITVDNQVHLGDQLFDINYLEDSHANNGKISFRVQSEHVSYRLIDDTVERYTFNGTPEQILDDLLSGTDFTTGTVDFTTPLLFQVNKTSSKYSIILELANQLGGEVDFSNFEISILNTIGQNNGYEIRVEKNLKGLRRTIDKRGTLKVSYVIDIVNIFKSDEFKRRNLEDLEKVDIGDVVRVYDDQMNIDVSLQVIELSKDVLDDRNLKLTLSNELELITDVILANDQNAIKRDEKIYGVTINDDVGIVIERTDKFAKTVMNAEQFTMQVGDGLGAYTDAVFFDILQKLYKFIGILEVENSGVTVKIDPGGTNVFEIKDGATELFTVDNTGKATYKADIVTEDDIVVGNVIQIGSSLSSLNGILFGPAGVLSPFITVSAAKEMVLSSDGGIELATGSGTLDILGKIKTFGASVVVSDSFTSAGGKTITVQNGLITSIV